MGWRINLPQAAGALFVGFLIVFLVYISDGSAYKNAYQVDNKLVYMKLHTEKFDFRTHLKSGMLVEDLMQVEGVQKVVEVTAQPTGSALEWVEFPKGSGQPVKKITTRSELRNSRDAFVSDFSLGQIGVRKLKR